MFYHRNPWLAQAMVNLNMIDTLGYGIHRMIQEQRKRFFPLPQFNLHDPDLVELVIYGHSIDEKYSKLLLRNTNLPLSSIILLDRFQKKLSIPDKELISLKKARLISGRKTNYHISEQIAMQTGQLEYNLKTRCFDNAFYTKMVFEFIDKNKDGTSKGAIKKLLRSKLPDVQTKNRN